MPDQNLDAIHSEVITSFFGMMESQLFISARMAPVMSPSLPPNVHHGLYVRKSLIAYLKRFRYPQRELQTVQTGYPDNQKLTMGIPLILPKCW